MPSSVCKCLQNKVAALRGLKKPVDESVEVPVRYRCPVWHHTGADWHKQNKLNCSNRWTFLISTMPNDAWVKTTIITLLMNFETYLDIHLQTDLAAAAKGNESAEPSVSVDDPRVSHALWKSERTLQGHHDYQVSLYPNSCRGQWSPSLPLYTHVTKTQRFFVIIPVVPPGRELMGSGDKASKQQLLFGLLCVSPDQTADIVPGLRDHLHGGPLIIHAEGRGGPAVDQA